MESDYISQDNPLYEQANDPHAFSTLAMPQQDVSDVSDEYNEHSSSSATYSEKAGRCHTAEVASIALLLLAIAVLAIVAYCAFSKRKVDCVGWPVVDDLRKEMDAKIDGVRGSVVFVEKDDDGNVKADSVRDKYIVGFYYVNGRRENFSVFYNHSGANTVNGNYTLEDIGGVLYMCSAEKKNCSAVDVEEAYEKPTNITKEVIAVGDGRYATKERGDWLEEKMAAIAGKVEKDVDFEKFREDPDGVAIEGNFTYNGKVYNIYKVYKKGDTAVDAGEAGTWEINIAEGGVEVCRPGKESCLPLSVGGYKKVDYYGKEEVDDLLWQLVINLKSKVK